MQTMGCNDVGNGFDFGACNLVSCDIGFVTDGADCVPGTKHFRIVDEFRRQGELRAAMSEIYGDYLLPYNCYDFINNQSLLYQSDDDNAYRLNLLRAGTLECEPSWGRGDDVYCQSYMYDNLADPAAANYALTYYLVKCD